MRRGPKRARVHDLEKDLAESLEREAEGLKREAVAKEQLAATAEILRVISRSQTDVQPVFDTIAASAVRLCDGLFSALFRFDGELMHQVAQHNYTPEALEAARRVFPARPTRALRAARAILDRAVVHVPDAELDAEFQDPALGRAIGYRSVLSVPMLRESVPVGVISVGRAAPGPFSDEQIALLQTFADQAVIAIENVRLFTELQEKNRALTNAHGQVTEALEQQTATSEILRVISSVPTNLQPVLDTIATNAVRVCGAYDATVLLREGAFVRRAAHHGPLDSGRQDLVPIEQGFVSNRSILDGKPVHLHDVLATQEADFARSRESARRVGFRTILSVPLLHDSRAIGALNIRRREIRPFSDSEIALLQTFVDQAVIAIENVRLFTELQEKNRALTEAHARVSEALERQTATSEILRVISSSPTDVQPVFDAIARNAVTLCGGIRALVLRFDGEMLHAAGHHNIDSHGVEQIRRAFPQRPGRGTPVGRAFLDRRVVHVPDLQAAAGEFAASTARQRGVGSMLAVPLLREQEAVGVIGLAREVVGPFSPEQIEVLQTFADQAVIAIENVRLFKELEVANHELAAASRHKSEFLANMSHELRTPLNAIIGFSEVLSERMFGELNEKQEEYSKDIHASGQHLLSLINDILDLSKIEAGRMELELSEFHLATALDSALTLVRERAGRRGITLQMNVDNQLGQIQADERKVRQVVLNLLSNAIKFTPEGGRIEVGAAPRDGLVEVSVSDTGVGIAPEDQEAVFEEFRQVGTTDQTVEGTGLGLTLCRKFVELHGGRIWVKSQVGAGSTFTFTIPMRQGE